MPRKPKKESIYPTELEVDASYASSAARATKHCCGDVPPRIAGERARQADAVRLWPGKARLRVVRMKGSVTGVGAYVARSRAFGTEGLIAGARHGAHAKHGPINRRMVWVLMKGLPPWVSRSGSVPRRSVKVSRVPPRVAW